MKINYMFTAIVLTIIFLCCCQFVSAQGFKGITSLESTCEDVKRILQIDECQFPRGTYWLKEYTVSISFTKDNPGKSDKFCYKVPAGRVSSIVVSYHNPVLVKDFEYELKYEKDLNDDINQVAYSNVEKGVSVLSQNGFATSAIFVPTPEQHKKFAYKCKTSNK
jgi:hypothetical protein